MEIRESVGYVSERMEKMEWEDIGKYRVRGESVGRYGRGER